MIEKLTLLGTGPSAVGKFLPVRDTEKLILPVRDTEKFGKHWPRLHQSQLSQLKEGPNFP